MGAYEACHSGADTPAIGVLIVSNRKTGMGGHQSSSMVKEEWLTPPELLKRLGEFDLDPCAAIDQPWPTAKAHYTRHDNGLRKPWVGRVFLNPPYGGPALVGPWMRRMAAHNHGTALIFARTETALFFQTVWRGATAVLFIEGRLYFYHGINNVDKKNRIHKIGELADANAGAPSVLIAYGAHDAQLLKGCSDLGHFVRLKP